MIPRTPLSLVGGYELSWITTPSQFDDLRLDIIHLGLRFAFRDMGNRFVPYAYASGGYDIGRLDSYVFAAGLGIEWRVTKVVWLFSEARFTTVIDREARMISVRLGAKVKF